MPICCTLFTATFALLVGLVTPPAARAALPEDSPNPIQAAAPQSDTRALFVSTPANNSAAGNIAISFKAGKVSPGIARLDFGGQSMGTTSPSRAVILTNGGSSAVTIASLAVSDPAYAPSSACGTLAAGAVCTVVVTFTPPANGATPLNGTVSHPATLSIVSDAPGSPHTVTLAGLGEKSLVTHYYRSILQRSPDAGGVPYWQGEAARVADLGANVNETWFALAQAFYASPEYLAFNRDDHGFVTDLYATFFNRAPDGPGLGYWTSVLTQGMPREVVLVWFMFSTEFANFTQAIFGNTAARGEVDIVMDFYRGLLSRLPDGSGLDYWGRKLVAAHCDTAGARGAGLSKFHYRPPDPPPYVPNYSPPAPPIYAQLDAVSSAFTNSDEYFSRRRSNAQFVGDMYNAFLRRGGELYGVQYWIGQLDEGVRTRENVRQAFMSAPEFDQRVRAVINQGCL